MTPLQIQLDDELAEWLDEQRAESGMTLEETIKDKLQRMAILQEFKER